MNARNTLTLAGVVAVTVVLASCAGASAPVATTGSSAPVATTGSPSPAVAATSQPAAGAGEVNPSGDIPDNQAYVAFRPVGGGYSVKIPEGWSRTSTGPLTLFTDKLNSIEVSASAASAQPTVAAVNSTDVPSIGSMVPKFAKGKVSEVVRGGGKAILLTYQGDSAPDQVTGKVIRGAFERYTFYHAGRRVDLTLSGPAGADNVDPWRIVSDSFKWN